MTLEELKRIEELGNSGEKAKVKAAQRALGFAEGAGADGKWGTKSEDRLEEYRIAAKAEEAKRREREEKLAEIRARELEAKAALAPDAEAIRAQTESEQAKQQLELEQDRLARQREFEDTPAGQWMGPAKYGAILAGAPLGYWATSKFNEAADTRQRLNNTVLANIAAQKMSGNIGQKGAITAAKQAGVYPSTSAIGRGVGSLSKLLPVLGLGSSAALAYKDAYGGGTDDPQTQAWAQLGVGGFGGAATSAMERALTGQTVMPDGAALAAINDPGTTKRANRLADYTRAQQAARDITPDPAPPQQSKGVLGRLADRVAGREQLPAPDQKALPAPGADKPKPPVGASHKKRLSNAAKALGLSNEGSKAALAKAISDKVSTDPNLTPKQRTAVKRALGVKGKAATVKDIVNKAGKLATSAGKFANAAILPVSGAILGSSMAADEAQARGVSPEVGAGIGAGVGGAAGAGIGAGLGKAASYLPAAALRVGARAALPLGAALTGYDLYNAYQSAANQPTTPMGLQEAGDFRGGMGEAESAPGYQHPAPGGYGGQAPMPPQAMQADPFEDALRAYVEGLE